MAEKILIVDDDEEFANLLGLLLTKKGYETKVTYYGADAIEAAKTFNPALILQDYMLPDIFGMELLKGLRQACPETRVVIITAKGNEEVAVDLMKNGAADYLRKPFESEKLLITVENVLKLKTSESELARLNKELIQQNQELTTINALSNALISNLSPDDKYNTAVAIIMKNLRADLVNLFVGTGRHLTLVCSAGGEGVEPLGDRVVVMGNGFASYVAELQRPAVVIDFAYENRFKVSEELVKRGLVSGLAVPLMVKDSVKGALVLCTKDQRTFNSFDIKLVSNFANLLAMAFENDNLAGVLGNFQRQWQVTFDAVPDRVTVQDKDHTIIMANKAAAAAAGCEVSEILGQKCSWIFHSRKETIDKCPVAEAITSKNPVHRELILDKNGDKFEIWAYPVFDKDGDVLMVTEYARKVEA
ncbi:MAG TPA: response regulator [Nitrospirota bacterium]